jgi:hypothetical protein
MSNSSRGTQGGTSRTTLQVPRWYSRFLLWHTLSVQEELRDALIAKGEGRYSFYNLQYSARHASPLVVENSMQDVVYQFVELFFRTETMQMYAMQWTTLMKKLLLGFPGKAELWEAARKADVELDVLIPVSRLPACQPLSPSLVAQLPDDEVVGGCYSTCNLIEHAYPCILYIAAKYIDDPEGAIVVSANLGGDSTNRTALVAALMGGCMRAP